MDFSERPPSKQWAALKYEGHDFAGVWFKPEGDPFALTFRILQKSFHLPGLGQQLTVENLLKAVGLSNQEIESWRVEGVVHSGLNGSNPDLGQVLAPASRDVPHLDVHVSLKPPHQVDAPEESSNPEIHAAKWLDLEARWKTLLGLEATMEALRQRMDGLRAQLESSFNKTLTAEEKAHALNNDVAQWTKAKSRVHHAIPKAKEFIHRATWALGVPERKKLEEIFKSHILLHIPVPEMEKLPEQLENLMKDRQILTGHGASIYQECSTVSAEIQAALRTVQNNAATRKRKSLERAKGKSS